MPVRSPFRFLTICALLSVAACAKQEIVHDLEERDANEIVVILDAMLVSIQVSQGLRQVLFGLIILMMMLLFRNRSAS